jgi:hypothetical protein
MTTTPYATKVERAMHRRSGGRAYINIIWGVSILWSDKMSLARECALWTLSPALVAVRSADHAIMSYISLT